MPPSTELSGETVTKTCGEIIITMKNNTRNVYSFNCRFCGTIYMQMKKFSLHLEKDHELQLIQVDSTNNQKDSVKSGSNDEAVGDSLFLPEIKVEDYFEDDIKSEHEDEEQQNAITRNTTKKVCSQLKEDVHYQCKTL